ncbi:MAG: hypothetical protein ABEJ93_04605 [Candidatus Nanohalobium sp.]
MSKKAEIEVKDFGTRHWGVKEFEIEDDVADALATAIAKYGIFEKVERRVEEIQNGGRK